MAASAPPLTHGQWHPDPHGHAALRYWDDGWTGWVSDGAAVWSDAGAGTRPSVEAGEGVRFVLETFLPSAFAAGLLAPDTANRLHLFAQHLGTQAAPPSPPRHEPLTSPPAGPLPGGHPAAAQPVPGQAPPRHPAVPWVPAAVPTASVPVAVPTASPHAAVPAPGATPYQGPWVGPRRPQEPSPLARWWARTRDAVGSDLAVHGLAYLGVLLLFVGVFGLVAFAFGDVAPSVRPLAELTAAAVPFLAARLLLGHGAVVAGRAMEVVGGLLVPLMVVTSMVDGFPFPPDLTGAPLVATLTAACAGVAVGYRWWAGAHPASGLRFAAAPAVWLGAGMATLAAGRPMPSGQDVAVPSAIQVMAMSVALLATVVAARRRPADPVASATRTAAVPGLLVLVVLALTTSVADGFPSVPVATTAVALLLAAHLLRPTVPDGFLDVGGPLWWAVAASAVAEDAPAVAGPLAALGAVALLEVAVRRRRPWLALVVPYVLLVAGLLLAADARWAAAATWTVAVWAVWRRARPVDLPGFRGLLSPLAAALPVLGAVTLGLATGRVSAVAVSMAALTALGASHRLRRAVSTGPDDRFWLLWWWAATPLAASVAVASGAVAAREPAAWVGIGCLAVCTAAAAVGPVHAVLRPPFVTVLATAAVLASAYSTRTPAWVTTGVLALAALAMIVAARPGRLSTSWSPASLAASGHGLALAAVLGAAVAAAVRGVGLPTVTAIGLLLAGVVVTALRDEKDRSPLTLGAPEPLRHVPWVAAAIITPLLLSLAAEVTGVLPAASRWAPVLASGAALTYLLLSRTALPARAQRVAPRAGFALAALVAALTWSPWPAVAALAVLASAPLVLPRTARHPVMVWTAWTATLPVAGLVATQLWPWLRGQDAGTAAALTGVAGGALLWTGAAALDLRGRRWTPRLLPVRPPLQPPAVVGAAALLLGGAAAAVAVPRVIGGVLVVTVAVVLVVVALLTRFGSLAGVGVALAWAATVSLTDGWLRPRPWVAIVVSTLVLVVAAAVHRLDRDRGRWTRWDVPLLVAAAPVLVTALDAPSPLVPVVYSVVGLEVVAVAVRLRRRPVVAEILGWTGTALITAGAASAGTGWLAVALLALSAAHTALAVHAAPHIRPVRQGIGAAAAVAAWLATLVWSGWDLRTQLAVTAAGAGAVALAVAVAGARRWLGTSWVVCWTGTASAVALGAAAVAWLDPEPAVLLMTWPVVGGLTAVTGAAVLLAEPLRAPALRWAAAGGALAVTVSALEASGAPASARALTLSLSAVAVGVLTLLLRGRSPAWDPPVAGFGGALAAVAAVVALGAADPAAALVPALAAAAVQVATAGIVLRSFGLQVLAPVLGCVSWLLLVASTSRGPQWSTVAIGLAVLVVVALWRRDRRGHELPVATPEIVALELTGVAILVGAALVQAVTVSVVHGFTAVGLGALVVGWGAVTRVRRRVVAGVVVVLAALVLVLAVPLVSLLPAWGGAGMWVAVAALGLVAVLAATLLERARAAAQATRGRLERLTAGWE